jgi:hypothetical protein
MSKEAGMFMSLVAGEMQRGGLPHSIYGQLEFQLSGFAINTLRQGVESMLVPRLKALERAYRSMFHLICDQYITGAFKSMELSGQDQNRMYFREEITPDMIKDSGDVEVTLIGQLPQDEMTKMSMAQIAREGETPLLSDTFIRDNILGLQSADAMEDSIKMQVAETTLPEAQLWTLLQTALRQGREDLVEFYQGELMRLLTTKIAEQAQMQTAQAPPQPQAPPPGPPPGMMPPGMMPPGMMPPGMNGAGPGLPPQVMPNAGLGVPPPAPVAPPGPSVPPGTPRPGAQGIESRLANLGMIRPAGG